MNIDIKLITFYVNINLGYINVNIRYEQIAIYLISFNLINQKRIFSWGIKIGTLDVDWLERLFDATLAKHLVATPISLHEGERGG